MYPTFLGTHGPSPGTNPRHTNALEYVQRLWTLEVCELIVDQTNRYMVQRQAMGLARKGPQTTTTEMWTFLGIILVMGVHNMPRYRNYWGKDEYMGIEAIRLCMPRDRFMFLLRHLHLVDEATAAKDYRHYKIKPLLDKLQATFLRNYNPTQEIVVDELMIKCEGRAKGIVCMPKKPVKRGFKAWSLSCSCCGYLCNFQLYPCLPQPCPVVSREPCRLVRVGDAGLKRGKCHRCLQTNSKHPKFTSFCCLHCRVRLCKIGCYDTYHKL